MDNKKPRKLDELFSGISDIDVTIPMLDCAIDTADILLESLHDEQNAVHESGGTSYPCDLLCKYLSAFGLVRNELYFVSKELKNACDRLYQMHRDFKAGQA